MKSRLHSFRVLSRIKSCWIFALLAPSRCARFGHGTMLALLLFVPAAFASCVLIAAIPVFAALPPTPDSIAIQFSPENPGPNASVEAHASLSGGGSITEFDTKWSVNGAVAKTGKGIADVSFRTGKLGSATVLALTLAEGSESITKTITLRPASVVLVGESDSTTPPFYQGKALFTYHGSIRVAAIPFFGDGRGGRMNPKTLRYTWRIADHVPEGSSGVGRDVFLFYAKVPFRPTEIEVEVATLDGSAVAMGTFLTEAKEPRVFLYENHPLYGTLWNRALGSSLTLPAPEIRMVAQPFFFNTADAARLSYRWTQNSQPVGSPSDKSVVFRKEGAEGSANIKVEITNPNALFQFGDAQTMLTF